VTTIVAVHSFRRGVGRTHLAANAAALLARDGARVGAVDFGDDAFGIPAIFGVDPQSIVARLADYFWGRSPIERVAFDVTARVAPTLASGRLFVLPSVLWREWLAPDGPTELDRGVFQGAIQRVLGALALDWLWVEAGSGLGDEGLLSAASASILIEVVRPDAQDLQGTAVMLDLAERLGAGRISLVVSQALSSSSATRLRRQFEAAYQAPVAAVLPLAPELAHPSGSGLLAITDPLNPWSAALRRFVDRIAAGESGSTVEGAGEWTFS
jgi:septum site-determining protein MinD